MFNKIEIHYRQLFLLCIGTILILYLPTAMAQLPTGSSISVPGTADGDSWLKKFAYIIRFVVFLMCMAAVGLGLSESIFSIFRTINDARTSGEWGPAIRQIGIIIGALIFAVVIFGLLNEFVLTPIEKYFTT